MRRLLFRVLFRISSSCSSSVTTTTGGIISSLLLLSFSFFFLLLLLSLFLLFIFSICFLLFFLSHQTFTQLITIETVSLAFIFTEFSISFNAFTFIPYAYSILITAGNAFSLQFVVTSIPDLYSHTLVNFNPFGLESKRPYFQRK